MVAPNLLRRLCWPSRLPRPPSSCWWRQRFFSGRRGDRHAAICAGCPAGGVVCCVGTASSVQHRLEVVVCFMGILVCRSVPVVYLSWLGECCRGHGWFVWCCCVLGALLVAVIWSCVASNSSRVGGWCHCCLFSLPLHFACAMHAGRSLLGLTHTTVLGVHPSW